MSTMFMVGVVLVKIDNFNCFVEVDLLSLAEDDIVVLVLLPLKDYSAGDIVEHP